jgi:hypothetical protein
MTRPGGTQPFPWDRKSVDLAERSRLEAIAAGELDDHLARWRPPSARAGICWTRWRRATRLILVCEGDFVRINGRISPRYLAGLDGTVVEVESRRDGPARAAGWAVRGRVRAGAAAAHAGQAVGVTMSPEAAPIEGLIGGLTADELREVVSAAVDRHGDVQRQVRPIAARAQGDLAQLRAEVARGLRTRRFLDYRESNGWALAARPVVASARLAMS